MNGINKLTSYLTMIKFSHSIFALPFAFTSAMLAENGIPSLGKIFWITVAMVSARSGAMGMNRIIDRKIDALNPRTRKREIPSGVIKPGDATLFTILSILLFVTSAYMLNPLCLKLSPFVILVLYIYSYTKRFTWMSHLVLGVAISLAPFGAWVAVKGEVDIVLLPLIFAVIFWLAGFDILYALQDLDFDRKHGLYSIPQRFGINRSLTISRTCHMVTWFLLLLTGIVFKLGAFYLISLIFVAGLLIYEHSLVKHNDLSKLNMAFFNMNGYISMTIFIFTMADILFL